MGWPRTLAAYPFVIVRLSCDLCPHRRGRYRLARLVALYGPDADLERVARDLARPCPRLEVRRPKAMRPGCHATYPDLERRPRRGPDVPRDA